MHFCWQLKICSIFPKIPLFHKIDVILAKFYFFPEERSVYAGVEKKIEFKLVLWASTFHIFLAQGHFLLVVVNNFVRGWLLSWAVPIGQVISFKNFLPGKKIYLSQTSRQGFFDWSLDNDYQLLLLISYKFPLWNIMIFQFLLSSRSSVLLLTFMGWQQPELSPIHKGGT